jgi:hypothetical protein
VQKLFRHDEVRRHLRAVANLEKIEKAIPALDDETLARLAAESRRIEDDLRAGKAWQLIVVAALVAIIVIAVVSSCAKADNVGVSCL